MHITGTGFRDLSTLTVLKELYLIDCFNLTDDGVLECMCACRSLRKLCMGTLYGQFGACESCLLTEAFVYYLKWYASPTLTHLTLLSFEMEEAETDFLSSRFKLSYSDDHAHAINAHQCSQSLT